MADKNIQIKYEVEGGYDNLFPATKESIVFDDNGVALKDKLISFDAQLADTTRSRIKQSPPPPKQGVITNSPKIVVLGGSNDSIKVVQSNGPKYVISTLDTANGDTGSSSVGGSWDLIRLKKVALASNAYVAKSAIDSASTVGTLATLFAPAARNSFETYMVYAMSEESTSEYLSSTGDGYGLGVYSIVGSGAASSVSWHVKTGSGRKCNALIYGSAASSTSADILVNGEVVKSFNPSALGFGAGAHYKTIDFEIPQRMLSGETVTVTLRNNDTTGKLLYFVCLNFMFLKEYDGRDVDFFKVFGTNSYFINSPGASDYAIFDHDIQKFVGSFHGGETRISAKLTWYGSAIEYPMMYNEGRFVKRNKSSITDSWALLPSFEIAQQTSINGKGKMNSTFSFNVDGTIDMRFGFYEGSINVETFYTALTATDVGFTYIGYPNYVELPAPDQKGYTSANDGYVEQQNLAKTLTLGIRHTKFTSDEIALSRENGWIQNHATNYKKYYYAAVEQYTPGVAISDLTFRKSLDFMYG